MTLEQINEFADTVIKKYMQHEVTYGVEHQRHMPDRVKEDYLHAEILANLPILTRGA